MADEREYTVTFEIDGIYADSPRAAAQHVADMLSPDKDGYAHRAVYEVAADGELETSIDLSEEES